MTWTTVFLLIVASGLGLLAGWLLARAGCVATTTRLQERDGELVRLRDDLVGGTRRVDELRAQLQISDRERERLSATLEAERGATAEKLSVIERAEASMRDAFEALSAKALKANNEAFLGIAKADFEVRNKTLDDMVRPVHEGLARVDETLHAVDRERVASHATLHEHLRLMGAVQQQLAGETQTLVRALRSPQVRGQWGEMQLKRVVELAGMVEHCDFLEQETVKTDDGRLRPDLVVRLPGNKAVVVDSKTPLSAYLDAMEATNDDQRDLLLDHHAEQVRAHITALAEKGYADEFKEAPDFVVLFLPGESFFSAACQRDPSLIEFAVSRGVIPASPTTLITILKAVAYGWQQERIAANAEEIRDLGQTLYDRVRAVAEHLAKVRKGLETAVCAYNGAVGSLETRVLPTARRFRDLGVGAGDEIEVLEPVDAAPRLPTARELVTSAAVRTLEEGTGDRSSVRDTDSEDSNVAPARGRVGARWGSANVSAPFVG